MAKKKKESINWKLLKEIGALTNTLDINEVWEKIFYLIKEAFGVETMIVALFRDKTVSFPLYFDEGKKIKREDRPFQKGGLMETVVEKKSSFLIRSFEEAKKICPNIKVIGCPTESFVSCPLLAGEKVIGVLSVQSYQEKFFTDHHKTLMEIIASLISSAVVNSLAHENTEKEVKKKTRELEEAQAQVMQAEKMAVLGKVAAGIAHEINNPVGTIMDSGNLIERHLKALKPIFDRVIMGDFDGINKIMKDVQFEKRAENMVEMTANIMEYSERIAGFVKQLRKFIRKETSEVSRWEKVDIRECISDALVMLEYIRKKKSVKVSVESEANKRFEIFCCGSMINQLITNIVANAYHAVEDGGEVKINCLEKEDNIYVEISDNGIGIPKELQKKIFDIFFTTKPAGEGTGLGLAISQNIVREYNGEILVKSKENEGTTVTIILPRHPEYAARSRV